MLVILRAGGDSEGDSSSDGSAPAVSQSCPPEARNPKIDTDPIFAGIFDELMTNGEIAAMRFVGDELDRLSADSGYDPGTLAEPRLLDGAP